MRRISDSSTLVAAAVMLALMLGLPGQAAPIPAGWTCLGDCGTLGPDGDVPAPPGGSTYQFVSTSGGPTFSGLNLGFNETNGSLLTTNTFSASGSSQLAFNFNFVTSDGAGSPDYAYARLLPSGGSPILLFTARTCQTTPCNTVPGVGMPALGAGVTLVPPSTPVTPHATEWDPLGASYDACSAVGCGNSGWIQANFTPAAGTYTLEFGRGECEQHLLRYGFGHRRGGDRRRSNRRPQLSPRAGIAAADGHRIRGCRLACSPAADQGSQDVAAAASRRIIFSRFQPPSCITIDAVNSGLRAMGARGAGAHGSGSP
jgi:hypothetical protein